MENALVEIRDYGHIEVNIRKYMDKRGITRYALAKALNTRFEVVDKWYKGHVEKIDADVLARMCYVLGCKTGDILIYKPQEKKRK